jgi:hypothetical protein
MREKLGLYRNLEENKKGFYMKTKYIVGEINTSISSIKGAIVFPEYVPHQVVATLFQQITGAGFCYVRDDAIVTYGESVGLKVKSQPEDKTLVEKCLGLGNHYG